MAVRWALATTAYNLTTDVAGQLAARHHRFKKESGAQKLCSIRSSKAEAESSHRLLSLPCFRLRCHFAFPSEKDNQSRSLFRAHRRIIYINGIVCANKR